MSKDLRKEIIPVLDEFASLMKAKRDNIRSRSYEKARDSLIGLKHPITKVEDFKSVKNIGEAMYKKITEFLSTGEIGSLNRLRETVKNIPEPLFSKIYGVGPVKEKQLIASGVNTIEELRSRQDELLNNVQKIGLKYYEDILEKIPRAEIDGYSTLFQKSFQKVTKDNEDQYEIVGSYRRGHQQSGDIDVIITSNDKMMFTRFIEELQNTGIITETLSQGPTKSLVVSHINKKAKARRVDFMYTSPEEYPFAILYFTGSKAFNVVMRAHALSKGYTMNEHGITTKDKKRVNHVFRNEKDIFDFLGLVYRNPEERLGGDSIEFVLSNEILPTPSPSSNPIQTVPKLKAEKPNRQTKKEKKTEPKAKKTTIQSNIKLFRQDGIQFLQQQSEEQLAGILEKTNKAYRNEKPLLNDNEYDIIRDYVEDKYPTNLILHQIGAPVEKNKVTLPYFMGSMDKIKPDTNALDNWKKKYKGHYVLSCKLDGVSGLYTITNGEKKLYTRGDGKVGQDVSHLIPHIKSLPNVLDIVVRGEFIIDRNVFQEKYAKDFANARNLVSGIMNSKKVDKRIQDLDFVAYELIEPEVMPSYQMKILLKEKFITVQHTIQSDITNEMLSSYLVDWRTNYKYETDGVIVTNDLVYPRKQGNPQHSFAFKMVLSEQIAEAKVVDVIWSTSKSGYIKPKVRIEPIQLGGVTIEYATGFNGHFIESNKIGIGAMIEIIRSGDVIPYIKSVVSPANEPKMPSIPYVWNNTHVDIMVQNVEDDMDVLAKRVETFFTGLKVDGLSTGNLKKIHNIGFVTIGDVLKMKPSDFKKAGFVNTSEKMYNNVHDKVNNATLVDIMALSSTFGRGLGKRKIQPIIDTYPNIIHSKETPTQKIEMLRQINGIGRENAKAFVNNIDNFKIFVQNNGLGKIVTDLLKEEKKDKVENKKDTSHIFYEKKIVMTKVRDTSIIQTVEEKGGSMVDSVNKNVWVVIVKSREDLSNKVKKATELNIPVLTVEEFKTKYM